VLDIIMTLDQVPCSQCVKIWLQNEKLSGDKSV